MDLPPPPISADAPGASSLPLPDLPELESPPAPLPDLEHHEEELQAPELPTPNYEAPEPQVKEEVESSYENEYVQEEPQKIQSPPVWAQEAVAPNLEEEEISREETGVIPTREPVSPLFVSTNDYQTILAGIQHIRKTLGDSENIIAHLAEIKNNQEKVFNEWKTNLEDIERKIGYVDQIIVKSQEQHG